MVSFEFGLGSWSLTGGGGNYRTTGPDGYIDIDSDVTFPFHVSENPHYSGAWYTHPGGVNGSTYAELALFGAPEGDNTFFGPDGKLYDFHTENMFWAGLYQDIFLTAGQMVGGWARFGSDEYANDFRDFSQVTINGQVLWEAHLPDIIGPEGSEASVYGPWQFWQFEAPADAVYRLQLEIHGDDMIYSWGDFDGIKVWGGDLSGHSDAVPEGGSTFALLGLSLAGLALVNSLGSAKFSAKLFRVADVLQLGHERTG